MNLWSLCLPVAGLLAVEAFALPSPAKAQAPAARANACAEQLSEDFTLERESKGLDGVVTPNQYAEFVQQCRKDPAMSIKAERDAARCVGRHLYWIGERNQTPQPAELTRITQACQASAQPISPALTAIPSFARAHGNIFAHAATKKLFLALEPRGSSGAAPPIPDGPFQSESDGSYAYTMVSGLAQGNTSMIVDLAMNKAILCHDFPRDNNLTYSENWTSNYYFDDQPLIERVGRCPLSLQDFEPGTLLDWRQHLVKPAASAATAAPSARLPAEIQKPVAPIAGLSRFSGHCNGYALAGRDYLSPGPCANAVELLLPPPGQSDKPKLTIRIPNTKAPVLEFQFDQATQTYINNDVITFDATPLSALPFSWTANDRLQCTFNKSPSDGWAKDRAHIQPSATLNCSFNGNPLRDADKLRFAFFADTADIARFRAAFVAASDRLNPGRPFVSPGPDIRTPQPN